MTTYNMKKLNSSFIQQMNCFAQNTSKNKIHTTFNLLLIIILSFLIRQCRSCSGSQNQITYYLKSDVITKSNPLTTCLSNMAYGIDIYCQTYYLDPARNVYDCYECNPTMSISIFMDSGRNFCGATVHQVYNYLCMQYMDSIPYISTTDSFTLYQCISCKGQYHNLIYVENFLVDLYGINLINFVCTGLPLISGFYYGQKCVKYEASSLQYDTTTLNRNENFLYLVCGICKTKAVSMDCSLGCNQNQYFIQYFQGPGFPYETACVPGGGTQLWDNSYLPGYHYGCPLYVTYIHASSHHPGFIGGCIKLVISNCKIYDSTTLFCQTCVDQYSLELLTNTSYVCTPYSISNCAQYDPTTLHCSICSNLYSFQLLSNSSYGCTPNSISNCKQYDSTSLQCSLCLSSYSLQLLSNSSYGCTPKSISNCKQYDLTTLQCSLCLNSYSLQLLSNSSYGCTSNSIKNCKQYDPITLQCSLCLNSYSLQLLSNSSYGCTSKSISNCKQYDSTALSCSLCLNSYSLQLLSNSSFGCTSRSISNCAQYDSISLICSLCQTQFLLQPLQNGSSSCIPLSQLVQFCQIYILNNNQLFSCFSCLFFYNVFQISSTSQICNPSNKILGCLYYSTQLVNGIQKPYCLNCQNYNQCIESCLEISIYQEQSICSTCISNQKSIQNQNGKSICVSNDLQIPSFCLQIDISRQSTRRYANTNVKCLKCAQYNYLDYQSNLCIPSVLYCASYLGTICTQCIQPYSLVNQSCVNPSPLNCDVYNLSSGNCSKCKNEYFLNSLMKCDPYKACPNYQYLNTSTNECSNGQIKNCLTYFDNGIQCSQCQTNYQVDSLGFSCKYIPSAVICPNSTEKIKYEVFQGKCVQININCKYYLESGYCYQCLDGYYQFNGSCYFNSQSINSTLQTQSIVCQNDQYLVGVNCIKIPNNCILFNKQLDSCQVCVQGYKLNNNHNNDEACVLVTVCPLGQYLLNITCTLIDVSCLNFNFSTNNCDLCAEGFISNGSTCLQTVDSIYNNSRMWFDGSKYIQISQTCQTFSKTSGQCQTCFSPYVIIFPGIYGLIKNSSIITCPKNTVQIANQICATMIQNCNTYQLIFGYCLTCVLGYQINSTLHTCTKIVPTI